MPGKEIKGRSKIANYRYGGRIGFKEGTPQLKIKKKYELRKQGLDVKFKSGGIASGIRRFNRGGKV